MWWKGALKGGPEIDTATIKGRRAMPAGKKSFSEVYKEAQTAFIEKMKVEGPGKPGDTRTVVELPDDDGESDDDAADGDGGVKAIVGDGSSGGRESTGGRSSAGDSAGASND